MDGLDEVLGRGDRRELELALAADPGLVDRPLGERSWLPLLHVTHSELLGTERTDDLLDCARLLLDAGADPNASWQHPE